MLDEKFWERYFKAYDALNSALPYQALLSDIIDATNVKTGESIFDAGSGTGNLAIRLKRLGARVTAMDFAEAGIKIHRQKDPEADVVKGNLLEPLPYADASFDKIVTNNVIYTIAPDERGNIFKEFYRMLKPGGIVVTANINKGFKPLSIFKEHIRQSVKKNGLIRTLADLITMSLAIVRIFYYNHKIKSEHHYGSYDFVGLDDQAGYLKQAGFEVVGSTKISYAGQSYINIGAKP